jgi:protein gp37
MGENSKIAWTNHTWNPWIGCTKVGPGCEHCYAEAWDARFSSDQIAAHWGPGAPRRRTSAALWAKPTKWNAEAERTGERPWVFCASLADVFDNEAPVGARCDLFNLVSNCQNLRWQFVTKRIGNAAKMLPIGSIWSKCYSHVGIVSTVVTQEECGRDLPKLIALKQEFGVAWVGLSIEPQLELVIPDSPHGLDWIITGGESAQRGASARPYDPHWARALIVYGRRNSIPIFVKQMGSNPIGLTLKDRAGANPIEWPFDLDVQEMP